MSLLSEQINSLPFSNREIRVGKLSIITSTLLIMLVENETIIQTARILGVGRKTLERSISANLPELKQSRGQKAKFRVLSLIGLKDCNNCNQFLSYSSFSIDNNQKSGLAIKCKDCQKTLRKNYREANHEVVRSYEKKYRSTDKAKITRAVNESTRRASKNQSTPIWYNELDELILEEIYALAKERQAVTGIIYHVDHVIPLKGKEVCGLHWYQNWRLIPAVENIRKSNKLMEELV